MNTKSVSIYIPAYNAEKTIRNSLESIKNQTIPFDEIIVIDDNSTDFTKNIVKEFNNVNIISNSVNKGLGYNRNLGVKTSSHQIVTSIDADVVLEKDWLEIMIKNFEQHQDIICGGKMIEKLTKNRFNAWRAKYYSQNWGDKTIENPPFLFGCNTIQNKSVWDTVGGYDDKLLTNGEDIDYSSKIKLHNPKFTELWQIEDSLVGMHVKKSHKIRKFRPFATLNNFTAKFESQMHEVLHQASLTSATQQRYLKLRPHWRFSNRQEEIIIFHGKHREESNGNITL